MYKQLSLMASLLVTLFIFVSDQCTKLWMDAHFELYESVKIINGFNLTLTHNTGMAFSLFSQGYFWQFLFLTIFPMLIIFAIVLWIYRICDKEKHLELIALSLILGGAFGNLLDRLRLGHVIDFIHVYWQNYHWPVFNIADSAITVGTVLLMWCLLKSSDNA